MVSRSDRFEGFEPVGAQIGNETSPQMEEGTTTLVGWSNIVFSNSEERAGARAQGNFLREQIVDVLVREDSVDAQGIVRNPNENLRVLDSVLSVAGLDFSLFAHCGTIPFPVANRAVRALSRAQTHQAKREAALALVRLAQDSANEVEKREAA